MTFIRSRPSSHRVRSVLSGCPDGSCHEEHRRSLLLDVSKQPRGAPQIHGHGWRLVDTPDG
jgi:hypothetical protein